jgi:hypothetical protein
MFRFPLLRSTRRPTSLDWWAYFGSFGDDFFGDDAEAIAPGSASSE